VRLSLQKQRKKGCELARAIAIEQKTLPFHHCFLLLTFSPSFEAIMHPIPLVNLSLAEAIAKRSRLRALASLVLSQLRSERDPARHQYLCHGAHALLLLLQELSGHILTLRTIADSMLNQLQLQLREDALVETHIQEGPQQPQHQDEEDEHVPPVDPEPEPVKDAAKQGEEPPVIEVEVAHIGVPQEIETKESEPVPSPVQDELSIERGQEAVHSGDCWAVAKQRHSKIENLGSNEAYLSTGFVPDQIYDLYDAFDLGNLADDEGMIQLNLDPTGAQSYRFDAETMLLYVLYRMKIGQSHEDVARWVMNVPNDPYWISHGYKFFIHYLVRRYRYLVEKYIAQSKSRYFMLLKSNGFTKQEIYVAALLNKAKACFSGNLVRNPALYPPTIFEYLVPAPGSENNIG
jgi:hypothetical protein